jgi:LmbE family N-acetylglucosaminyl deacetylase
MPQLLAAVFAHPDDEVFSMGGTIVRHLARGGAFALFCATPGDAGGSSGLAVSSSEELGAIRTAELVEALRILGASSDVALGGRRDGALAQADTDQLVGDVVRFLRERRPQVVVTFGPEGAPTGHRDHRAISRAATAAFFLAGRASEYPEQLGDGGLVPHAPDRLYYITWPDPPPDVPNRHEGTPATARVDTTATHATELRAFLAHRSQLDHRAAFERESLTPTEDFALVSGTPQPSALADDLFAGLGPGPALTL